MTTPLAPVTGQTPQSKGSGAKLIVIILAVAVLAGISLFAGIFLFVMKLMTSNGAYQGALEKARKNPEVLAILGEPIEPGMFTSGSINTHNDSGRANLSIPVSGPKGSGTIRVVAEMQLGVWTFSRLDLVSGATTISLARISGVVKSYDKAKAFGYITPGDGGTDLYVQQSDILEHGEPSLEVGQNVEYEIEETEKGPKAVRVKKK